MKHRRYFNCNRFRSSISCGVLKRITSTRSRCFRRFNAKYESFEEQSEDYRESVLPKAVTKRVAIEMGATFGWERFVGFEGKVMGIDRFGASAPGNTVIEEYGFTTENVVANYLSI